MMKLLLAFMLLLAQHGRAFDFFYLVLEWPGSYCDGRNECCYPQSGKPAEDFSIHGLWPNNKDGTFPTNCDPSKPFDPSQVADLRSTMNRLWSSLSCPSSTSQSFWSHEWEKHGTCSDLSSQHLYFSATLELRKQLNLLTALAGAGIHPDGGLYNLADVKTAIRDGLGGRLPGITCNSDASRQQQLYEVYVCVDKDAATIIDCPLLPDSSCPSKVAFPPF